MAEPNLKNENPSLLKITTKDDEIRELKNRTEKHDKENNLNSFTIDND